MSLFWIYYFFSDKIDLFKLFSGQEYHDIVVYVKTI